jgi:hypothetical protein
MSMKRLDRQACGQCPSDRQEAKPMPERLEIANGDQSSS